ncbi:ead/Ea22-like family protein [Escherichia coli]|nr:ead/Ea22-like family protein [Escherichia coli]
MSEINYQALREAAQNYQSTLAWYEAIADTGRTLIPAG